MHGPASPDVAWERYLHPERWITWAPHLNSVAASTPVLQRGTTGTVTALGVVTARFQVLSVDPESRSWSWVVRVGPVELVLHHSLRARAAGRAAPGTTAGITMTGPWPVLMAYRPLMRRALRRLVH
ncbi:Polyketide cyclase / dehydrase and lipid transport [Corynebacterium comes]|uniref:Polyketide cyclase / dehydrase and lipid transport n=1 Tax=Corynebacterium comes TaxID=2675218 RepID=A0A6B8VVQ4_9CORY|nr:Polyketide cyclase / dehydrase and lipid transport [Corynebacterium comes]